MDRGTAASLALFFGLGIGGGLYLNLFYTPEGSVQDVSATGEVSYDRAAQHVEGYESADADGTMAAHLMSAEAAALATQAEIAECMASEARRMAAAWALDVRSSRGYAPSGYEAEMDGMIAASIASASAMEAWADAARQAAVDGSLTADERAVIEAAERDMVDAEAAVHDAFASTTAGQIAGMGAPPVPSLADGYRQAAVLSGEGTECY